MSKDTNIMFSRKNKPSEIDQAQHEQLEYAQAKIRQKKQLFRHFVVFLIGCLFLFLINKIFRYGADYDWFLWVILGWAFLLVLHLVNVFVTHRFMGREWERAQREKLVKKQRERIAAMQKEIETEFPSSHINKKEN